MDHLIVFSDNALYRAALRDYLAVKFPCCIVGDRPAPAGDSRIECNGITWLFFERLHVSAHDIAQELTRCKNIVGAQHQTIRDFARMTRRERDVLSYLAKGLSNKDIANRLDLQVVTVKLHVRGICRKLGVSNRTQAALVAHKSLSVKRVGMVE